MSTLTATINTLSPNKAKGLLNYISDVEKIDVEKIATSFLFKGNFKIIENQLGNLLLYPQTVPITDKESNFDMVILKELLRLEPGNFYSPSLKKIYIQETFTKIFPNLSKLAFIFIEILKPVNLTSFFLKSENLGIKNLGTYIKPENITKDSFLNIYINQEKFHVPAGKITIIPLLERRIDIKLESNCNIIENKKELNTEVIGGEIGLIIDLCQPT